MPKTNNRKKVARQCVCCGFNASRGTLISPDKFICSACESESHGDDEQRYLEDEWAEINRIEAWTGRMETY